MNNTSQSVDTLAVDIGGSGIKVMVLEESNSITDRQRIPTPDPAKPAAVIDVICTLADRLGLFYRVSIGFPGVVEQGVTQTAPNLDDEWSDFELEKNNTARLGKPTRLTAHRPKGIGDSGFSITDTATHIVSGF